MVVTGRFANAGAQVGTVTLVQGQVKLLTHPGKTIQGPPPHALFQGLYYSARDAQVGDRLDKGNVIRTFPGAKARIIYDNGDQFHVAPATSFAITWDKDTAEGKPEMTLAYGGARGVIAKGGPRSHFVIRTRTAVMGVRGTDFFIGVDPETGATETATLRGSVSVASAATPEAPAVEVKAGQAASVAAPLPTQATSGTPEQEAPKIEVRKASQQELGAIQKTSEVKPEPVSIATPGAPPTESAKLVEKLEAQAQVATLNDIRIANPELAAKLDKNPEAAGNIDALNQASVAELVPEAPKEVASRSAISAVSEQETVAPVTIAEEPEQPRPPSRSSGFRLLRFDLSALNVSQDEGANSHSAELAWIPRFQLGSWGWIGYRTGMSLLKGISGNFLMFEENLVLGIRVLGPFSLEVLAGPQEWMSNGTGFEVGVNAVWFPEERSFGLVERWYVGFAHVGGGNTYIESSNANNGNGNNTCMTGCGTNVNLNAFLLRAGVGL
jgi:hypothetical protein